MERQTEHGSGVSTGESQDRFVVWLWRQARRVVVFVVGFTVLLIGVVMIIGPGPAIVVIPLGLSILATEFVWARRWLEYAKRQLELLSPGLKSREGEQTVREE